MLERKELENYLFDFEILSKKYPSINKPEYEKIVSDIKDQNLMSKAGELLKLCGVISGINKKDFKRQLAQHITESTAIYNDLKRSIFNGR